MKPYVCTACATFAEEPGDCNTCGETRLDFRRDDVRQLCEDIDSRKRRAREQQILWGAVALSMILVVGLWMVPGFWEARRQFFALPMLVDQLLIMTLLGFGLLKLGSRVFGARPRFPSGVATSQ
jgi:hypothetical protein